MKEKCIKVEDVKNSPPIEEIRGLETPTQVVEVNFLIRFDEGDIPCNKSTNQCLDEFDNFIVKQEIFNAYVSRQLKCKLICLTAWVIICVELLTILSLSVNMLLW